MAYVPKTACWVASPRRRRLHAADEAGLEGEPARRRQSSPSSVVGHLKADAKLEARRDLLGRGRDRHKDEPHREIRVNDAGEVRQ